ncbi:trigger factor [Methylibium petroleiphilum]|uniref:Trigger factor n=1 Tax=Methylibium petroleiphilum (strain ATCC BAA-1232 / LMG 22953 / PM1) TaxID=420662 RepID=TIG_METPP|nr:trigger factor [Methylibium petroleiphilum]A2SFB4.1 RecName: Full=Trigger factor; Short=TF; AltName: Full=PPIase [Methylibium petroleiphilum PM1]ABM94253.1 putative peptidyl-prolyl cis/trans isomerase (trigger factor) protein [Methylibium petroleiphilum PM1]
MAVTVETLEKLERRITLILSADTIKNEVEMRLKRLAKTVKADGFRPGKVPMSVVAQRYGYSVQYEVMNDKVGEAFSKAANEAQLRVAGAPRISEKEGAPEGELAFDATFEVYPDVKIGDLSATEIDRVSTEVTDAAIDKTLDILRKQRRTFAQRAASEGAVDGDRVTIDFEGKIDGVPFDGGKAEGFQFILGEGRMLEAFEKAVRGMKTGESKTFPLQFPDDYQGKEVAGKEADFLVTLTKIEAQHLPEVDEAFAQSLGIQDPTLEGLRADIRKNLEREVKNRLIARNKSAVMEALIKVADLDLPKALVQNETDRMIEGARADLKQRGIKDADKAPIPAEIFHEQAERRVRLGLVVAELVRTNQLQAKGEQIGAHIEEMALSYEKPEEVRRWYFGDRQRLAEVEALVVENNVTEFVLSKAKVSDKQLPFDELMV